MSIRIVTDSNCDLPEAIIDRYNIAVVPFYINIGRQSYLDGLEMSRAQFYEGLPHFDHHPMTSVPGPGTVVKMFEALAAEGATEVLAIHIGSSLSAMVNSARLAAEEFDTVPVRVFDSGNLTLGTGLQVIAAAEAVAQGRTMEEILAALHDMSRRTHCFAALETVEFLRRSGRLTRFQSGLASVLQIKPLLKMNAGIYDMERVRTNNGATQRLLDLTEALGPLEQLAVVHTHNQERADALRELAQHILPKEDVTLSAAVTPVIGTHIGPGAAGFVAVQARDTQAFSAKKEIEGDK
ncbi:MAG: DegV family protein [Anaerolineae bacterium]